MKRSPYSTPSIPAEEVTPEALFRSRRGFLKAAGLLGAGALLSACAPALTPTAAPASPVAPAGDGPTDELGDPANSFDQITQYNNYYEFSEDKSAVANLATTLQTDPWQVEVGGLVENPGTFSVDELLRRYPAEERIYRLRCVEGWSMVIPWEGFPLASLLNDVRPTADAAYVRFVSAALPDQEPGVNSGFYPWPYQEGLRLDEALNDLTLLATGLYGKPLPNQDGAPLRLVVPWKYGFKSAKSLVKIELVADPPATFWSAIAPNEYGFYANVNPDVPHPRWSQATERRIGEIARRKTLPFNGYADQVASLYSGMDLRQNY